MRESTDVTRYMTASVVFDYQVSLMHVTNNFVRFRCYETVVKSNEKIDAYRCVCHLRG